MKHYYRGSVTVDFEIGLDDPLDEECEDYSLDFFNMERLHDKAHRVVKKRLKKTYASVFMYGGKYDLDCLSHRQSVIAGGREH